jgi:hypothetical protein
MRWLPSISHPLPLPRRDRSGHARRRRALQCSGPAAVEARAGARPRAQTHACAAAADKARCRADRARRRARPRRALLRAPPGAVRRGGVSARVRRTAFGTRDELRGARRPLSAALHARRGRLSGACACSRCWQQRPCAAAAAAAARTSARCPPTPRSAPWRTAAGCGRRTWWWLSPGTRVTSPGCSACRSTSCAWRSTSRAARAPARTCRARCSPRWRSAGGCTTRRAATGTPSRASWRSTTSGCARHRLCARPRQPAAGAAAAPERRGAGGLGARG